ncbi:acetyl-coenzyme A synthetase [Deltaproteobacteria bacterium]|nr:acetyl-coenzyme A synthetase [Deltaproteobacteria bacterium]
MLPPKPSLVARSFVPSREAYDLMYADSAADPAGFWAKEAERLAWFHPWTNVVKGEGADVAWFTNGRLNVAYNCIDRHPPERTAIIWAANESGRYESITFGQLGARVARIANVLKAHGVRRGDRVCIYLPMVPELAMTMLACARIGAVHSVVFAGFSANALRERIKDAGARVLVTADEGVRGPRHIPLKHIADEAAEAVCDTVLVVKRTGAPVAWVEGRDHWLADEELKQRSVCPAEWMDTEDPLFILYTSGSTGKPKGLVHTTGGYLTYANSTFRWVFDAKPGDVHFCAADCGWITGHSYIVYGPLANGVTTVMFESLPNFPDASRYWQVCADVGATSFYTAPTALRALLREGDSWVKPPPTVRILGTVGEPINPEVWTWYHDVVGEKQRAVVDTWWQTETGGIMITSLPGAHGSKPGSAGLPLFGVSPVLVDASGHVISGPGSGNLCLAGSWPGQARTIQGDHARFVATYFSTYPGLYFTGDGCRRDEDGYYWITGRVDDVLNVAGHRIGTAEVESALVTHPAVAEAAVVGFPHQIKGEGIWAWVILKDGYSAEIAALREQVRREIGPIATPDHITIVPGLPKTRSGKIMRRILRKIAAGEPDQLGDTSTLADPAIVEALIQAAQPSGAMRGAP